MKKKLQAVIFTIIQLSMGGIVGFFSGLHFATFLDLSNSENLTILALAFTFNLYIAMTLHIYIHELGHLLFGLLTGYKFVSIRFFNLMFKKENGKIRVKKFSLAGTGGQCLLAPPDYNNGKFPAVLYNLGGSLLNMIMALLGLIVFFIHINPWLDNFLIHFIVWGIGSALLNGIPLQTPQIANDGANIVSICSDKEAKKAFYLQMKINELQSNNIRLKDMPNDYFTMSCDNLNDQLICAIEIIKAERYLDMHDFTTAYDMVMHLYENKNKLMGVHQQLIINDLLYLTLYFQDKKMFQTIMTKKYKKSRRIMKGSPAYLRTEFAYALSQGQDSSKIMKQFQKISKKYPYSSEIESELELIEIICHKSMA